MTRSVAEDEHQAGRGRIALMAALLVAVAFAAYANAWPNTMVLDDTSFLEFERYADWSAFTRHFSENAWGRRGLESELYRPLLLVSISVDANLFRDWFAGYHLVNILWHAAVSVLVFGFIAALLRREPGMERSRLFLAFCAALIFAVHPVQTEAVNSVFNRSSLMAAFGVVGGLWWLLAWLDRRPVLAWSGALLAYTFAQFCRESAIIMPVMSAGLVLLYTRGSISQRAIRMTPVLMFVLPMVLFLHLRGLALASAGLAGDAGSAVGARAAIDPGGIIEGGRLLKVAGTWAHAWLLLAWPSDLRIAYDFAPRYLNVIGVFLNLGLVAWGLFEYRRGRRFLLAGLALFYLALLLPSRLLSGGSIFPIQLRYLYLASVGACLILAGCLHTIYRRFDRLMAAAPVVLLVFILMPVTWARNTLWADNIALFESDYQKGNPNKVLLRLITAAYAERGDYGRVLEICDANPDKYAKAGAFAVHCAAALEGAGRPSEAEAAYRLATARSSSRQLAYSNLGRFYLRHDRWSDARDAFEKGVETETDPALRAYRTGYMLLQLYPASREKYREAAGYFEQALRLHPDFQPARTWLDRIDTELGVESEAQ